MGWRRWMTAAVLAVGLLGSGTACRVEGTGENEQEVEGEAQGPTPGGEEGRQKEIEANVLPADDNRPVAQRLRDVSIAANVRLKLADEAKVDPNRVNLLVQGGQVTLQGDVTSAEASARAEAAAKSVEGVRQVVNQLAVAGQPAPAQTPSPIPPLTGEQKQAIPPASAPAQPGAQPPTAEAPTAEARPAAPPPAAPPAAKPAPAATYKVKSGDNLGAIARRHGTTVESLKRLNGLRNNNIRVGQTLRVK